MDKKSIENRLQDFHWETGVSEDPLMMDVAFRDQGYDSLDEIELIMKAEKDFGISLSEDKLAGIKTPDQLVEVIIFHTHLLDGGEMVSPV